MPTKRFDFAYTETPLVELPTPLQKLAEEALKSTTLSYAPFSGFHVGCAVLLDNGEVVVGANQENASYPCGLCAERVALYNASTLHPKAKIVALAILQPKTPYPLAVRADKFWRNMLPAKRLPSEW